MQASNDRPPAISYSARDAYREERAASEYERLRFEGLMGRYRWRREQQALASLVAAIPKGATVLDCPCGTGRWWELLASRAARIIAVDVSPAMLEYAKARARTLSIDVTLHEAGAEQLPFDDESIDFVFSHALTKHLPWPVQADVLKEFGRVARLGVICSFGIFSHLSYEVWRRRGLRESYPMIQEELQWMAENAGLTLESKRKCTTPIGVEHSVIFTKG